MASGCHGGQCRHGLGHHHGKFCWAALLWTLPLDPDTSSPSYVELLLAEQQPALPLTQSWTSSSPAACLEAGSVDMGCLPEPLPSLPPAPLLSIPLPRISFPSSCSPSIPPPHPRPPPALSTKWKVSSERLLAEISGNQGLGSYRDCCRLLVRR